MDDRSTSQLMRSPTVSSTVARVGRLRSIDSLSTDAPPSAPPETQSLEIDRSTDDAFDRGFSSGREEGFLSGHKDGLVKGQEDGFAKGYEDGVKKAEAQGEVAVASLRKSHLRLQEIADAMERSLADVRRAAEEDVLLLCYEVLGRLLGNALTSPEGIRTYIAHALSAMGKAQHIDVHLNPLDIQLLTRSQESGDTVEQVWGRHVNLVPDDDVRCGGCLVFTAEGGLDARFETQLELLRLNFLKQRPSNYAPTAVEG